MDLQDQLKNLFPDHVPEEHPSSEKIDGGLWLQEDALLCKYEKRKGKVNTVIDGYNGAKKDFKLMAQLIKKELSVGGGIKNEQIVIQGDYRDRIMSLLKEWGFKVKRVGGKVMSNILHITNGDSLTDYLRDLGFTDTILTWQEMLCEGPSIPAIDSKEFFMIR